MSLNRKACREKLCEIQPVIEELEAEVVPGLLNQVFKSSLRQGKSETRKKPWFCGEVKLLRQCSLKALQCFRTSGAVRDSLNYARLRSAYHWAVRAAKRAAENEEAELLIERGNAKGIFALY